MRRTIALTLSSTRDLFSGSNEAGLMILAKIITLGKGLLFNVLGFGVLVGIWYIVSLITKEALPTPVATFSVFWELVKDPFYDYGPNDKGIGLQLGSSIVRVFSGFLLGAMIAIPMGLLIGASSFCKKMFYPIVQVLKPVSPLAWFPIGLVAFESASKATIFIIFITSLWPTLINTAFGVASLPSDHKNVAKAFGFSRWNWYRLLRMGQLECIES
jgi:nitrate/nitrite transport system permease protein